MKKTDRAELAKILYGLASNFGDGLDEYGLELWAKAFIKDGFSLQQIRMAAGRIFRTRKISKMPTYAEFVCEIQGDSKDRAEIQADEVLKFLRSHGAMAKPEFKDPVTRYLMTVRWPYYQWARTLLENKTHFWIKEFKEAYQTYERTNPEKLEAIGVHRGAPEKIQQLTSRIGSGK